MNVIKITHFDTANGPGIRTILWVAGCEHHCKGCHNQCTWDKTKGTEFSWDTHFKDINNSLDAPYISGVTLSGGDPLAPYNLKDLTILAQEIKERHPDKTIWLYTGYKWEEISHLRIMKFLDVVVDGEFIEEQKNISLPYCGSENQRVIDVQKSLKTRKPVLYWENPSL